MRKRIVITPKADRDLDEQFTYIAHDSLESALRYLDAVEDAFDKIADMPRIGRTCQFDRRDFSGIRRWPVPRFERHVIFYQATERSIEVVRILHTARDIDAVFSED